MFTYSPFSAMFFALLAPFGNALGLGIFTGLSLVIAALTAVFGVRYLSRAERLSSVFTDPWLRPLAMVAFGFIVALGPWRETTAFGQINILLFGLIMADYQIKARRWPHGVLVGIAAGIKLTPLVFGLYYLCTGNWRGLRNMAFGFLGTVGLGFLLMPKESFAYWFQLLPDTSRIGGAGYVDNLSFKGAILHFFGPDFAVTLPWLGLSAIFVVLTGLALRSAQRRGETIVAFAMTALLMVLISPITWSHHWVWIALFIPVLARSVIVLPAARKGLRSVGVVLLVLAVPIFLYSPKTIGTALGAVDLGSQIPTTWLMASSAGVFWGTAVLIWWIVAYWENPRRLFGKLTTAASRASGGAVRPAATRERAAVLGDDEQ
nr:glycosyltransferase 87 family protein [Psychromicrobium silvestre]